MVGQKLTKILESLSPEEFKRLKRALASPYFATNPRLLTLYDYLKKHYPDFDESKFQKEKLYKKLYPGKPHNDGVLRVLVREFSTVVEDFIMLERLRSDKHERKKMLVSEYGKRNLYEYFKKGTEELLAGFDDSYIKDMEYFKESIGLYQDYCFHPLTNNYDANDNSLENLMDSLDSYFVLAKYRFTQILRNKNTIFKKESKFRFFENIRNYEDELFIENKIIVLYELLNKLHDTNDENYFQQLKQIFFPVISKIKRTDCRIIYYIGLNYCSRQINSGIRAFSEESLNWYKKGLDHKLLIENNKMSDLTFTNIIASACRENEFVWAEKFIKEHENYLHETVKLDAINYSKSFLFFNQKKLDSSMNILNSHNFSTKYQLSARSLAIINIFEQAQIDQNYFFVLQSQIEAFKKYLHRNTMFSDSIIIRQLNFLKIIDKFGKKLWANEDKRKTREWIKSILRKEQIIVLKTWLIEKSNTI